MSSNNLRIVGLVVVIVCAVGVIAATNQCTSVPDAAPVPGAQGYRVWSGETLKSFEHDGARVCVPSGWGAVGALREGWGWAQFQPGITGVFIHSASFDSQTIQPIDSVYTVRVLYPKALAPEIGAYTRIIDNAFTRAGRLFGERRGAHPTLKHSVLITAGLAGNTLDEGTRVYPDPSARVSMFVRTPNYARAEELYIHAVMHLYNRQREGLLAYQELQSPFAAEDWQEMEATWAESAFNTSSSGREGRLKYLYNVHTAVVTKNFALISEPPFTDKDGFEKIVPSIAVAKGGAYLDYQYGHYVLAPLVMLAIEGLLQERKTGATVESMLLAVHAEGTRFFDNLAQVLSEKDLARIRSWSTGDGLIPMALLESAVAYYDSQ